MLRVLVAEDDALLRDGIIRLLEALGLMAQGKSNAAIAACMDLSERAIEKHSNSIFVRLGVSEERDRNRRVSAVLVYLDAAGPTL